jgi:hypothetical protein
MVTSLCAHQTVIFSLICRLVVRQRKRIFCSKPLATTLKSRQSWLPSDFSDRQQQKAQQAQQAQEASEVSGVQMIKVIQGSLAQLDKHDN